MIYNKYARYVPQYTSDNFNNKNRGMKQSKFVLLSYHHTHIPKCLAIIWNRLTIRNSHCFRIAKCTWYQDKCTYYYFSIDILWTFMILYLFVEWRQNTLNLNFWITNHTELTSAYNLHFFSSEVTQNLVYIYLSINHEKGNFHYHLWRYTKHHWQLLRNDEVVIDMQVVIE